MSSEVESVLSTRRDHISSQSLIELQYPHSCNDVNVESIWQTISQLEHYLIEDHRQDYKLRMALDRQAERLSDLHACLRSEKQRNKRLVDLILDDDSRLSIEDDYDSFSKASYVSISPMLMQQRYEDLCTSYNICRKQLIKRDRELKINKCEREMLQSKYDNLVDENKQSQKRLEQICVRYLSSQKFKNYEIQYLQQALDDASNCLIIAQKILATSAIRDDKKLSPIKKDFQQSLRSFLDSLKLSEWIHCKCNTIK